MMTAVGLSSAETAASVRAGTMRFEETSWLDRGYDPFVLATVPDDGLPDLEDTVAKETGLTHRENRMLRLGTMPLRECLKPIAESGKTIGLALALPDTQTKLPLDETEFLKRYAKQTGGRFDLDGSIPGFSGRAGGLLAVGRAAELIREESVDLMLAGGIDTFLSLYVLAALDQQQRVKSARNLDGFIPGEGAGLLLLASLEAASKAGLKPLAVLSPVVEGFEEGHLYSDKAYQGDGLSGTLEELFGQRDDDDPIQDVFCSMNGESHWGKEWGVAFMRNQDAFDPDHAIHHPADCFGDTGAASGPLLVGLAALGISTGLRSGPALVYCSSDHGQRAALIVAST